MINRLRLSSQKSAKAKSFLPIINYLKKSHVALTFFNTSKITHVNRVREIHSNKSLGSSEVGQYVRNPGLSVSIFLVLNQVNVCTYCCPSTC